MLWYGDVDNIKNRLLDAAIYERISTMRKLIVGLIMILILLMCSVSIAANNIKTISDTEFMITVPDGFYYGDKDKDNSSDLLKALNISFDSFQSILSDTESICFLTKVDFSQFIMFSVTDSILNDFTEQTENMLLAIGHSIAESRTNEKTVVEKVRLSKTKIPFVKVFLTHTDDQSQTVLYITAINGKQCMFVLQSSSTLTIDNEIVMDSIADGFSIKQKSLTNGYTVDDIPLRIFIPNNMVVFSKTEREAIQNTMNYAFFATTPDYKFRIHIDMINANSSLATISNLTDEEKEQLIPIIELLSEQQFGSGNSVGSLVDINGVTYLKLEANPKITDTPFVEISYTTVLNHKMFAISFDPELTKDGIVTEDSMQLMNDIIEGIIYDDKLLAMEQESDDSVYYQEYRIAVPDVIVRIPSIFNTFWKGMPANAPSLYSTGETVEVWDEIFEKGGGLFLSAETADQKETIDVSISSIKMPELKRKSDSDIWEYIKAVLKPQSFTQNGLTNSKYMILETNDYKYIIGQHECINTDYSPYFASAFTYTGDEMINVYLMYDHPFTDKDMDMLQTILSTMVIHKSPQEFIRKTDWVLVEDVKTKEYVCNNLYVMLPEDCIIYDKNTTAEDLIPMSMGSSIYDIKSLLNSLQSECIITDYNAEKSMSILVQASQGLPDFKRNVIDEIRQLLPDLKDSYRLKGLSEITSDLIYGEVISVFGKSDTLIWIKIKGKTRMGTEQLFYTTIIDNHTLLFTIEAKTMTEQIETLGDRIISTSKYHVD